MTEHSQTEDKIRTHIQCSALGLDLKVVLSYILMKQSNYIQILAALLLPKIHLQTK